MGRVIVGRVIVGRVIVGRVNGYRLGIAGHCVTNPEEAVHHTILWELGTYSW